MTKELEALEQTKDWYLEFDGSNYVQFGDTKQYKTIKQALIKQEKMKEKVKKYLELDTIFENCSRGTMNANLFAEYNELWLKLKEWSESNE